MGVMNSLVNRSIGREGESHFVQYRVSEVGQFLWVEEFASKN